MKIEAFTDGACIHNGRENARASWAVYFPNNGELSRAEKLNETEQQTNQRAELTAIRESCKSVKTNHDPKIVDLIIYTDSLYSKNCLTTWIANWERNGWKNSKGENVCHQDLIIEIDTLLREFNSYTIHHVKAHTGGEDRLSKCNAIVDSMATELLEPKQIIDTTIINNESEPLPGFPIKLMGPAISESVLSEWCYRNFDKIDSGILSKALISALKKTVKKTGFDIVKERLHSTARYKLVKSGDGIIRVSDEE